MWIRTVLMLTGILNLSLESLVSTLLVYMSYLFISIILEFFVK